MNAIKQNQQGHEEWLNLREGCLYLRISVPTGRRWIKRGILKPKRTPTGAYRLKRSELDALLD